MTAHDTQLTDSDLAAMMHSAGIRPSVQRIAILAHIVRGRLHPTADRIYADLSPLYPSLSRTTVYNTLHSLADAGLLRELEIESGNKHYDLAPQPRHGHFMCRRCGKIFDMPLPLLDSMPPSGFRIENVEVYYKGLCPDCIELTSNT